MTDRKEDRKYQFYVCGRCKHEIYHIKGEQRDIPCPECGWEWEEKGVYDIPSKIKFDLTT